MDLFVVPTISFRLLYGLLILRHDRRRILWMGVTAHPTAEWIAQQVVEACAWEWPPTYILRDRDRTYGEAFARRICAMGIRDRPTDVVVLGEQHLRHILLVVPELLQRPAHALVVGQRCAGSTRSAGSWQNCTDADPRRATSPIPPDLIYGRDRGCCVQLVALGDRWNCHAIDGAAYQLGYLRHDGVAEGSGPDHG